MTSVPCQMTRGTTLRSARREGAPGKRVTRAGWAGVMDAGQGGVKDCSRPRPSHRALVASWELSKTIDTIH